MNLLDRQFNLPNNLNLMVIDHSRRYFGDYHHVKLEIRCEIKLNESISTGRIDLEDARALLGEEVVYRRVLEKMAVPSGEVEAVQEKLLADFCEHSLSYFASPDFPGRVIAAELRRVQKRLPRAGS